MAEYIPIEDVPELRQQLARIAGSDALRRSRRGQSLLNYLAEETMSGHAGELNQNQIAKKLFGVKDPQDQRSVGVRIAAARLRDALREYYLKEAGPDEIRIHIPYGSYYVAVEQTKRIRKSHASRSENESAQKSPTSIKKISDNDVTGELGINLIQKLCLEMGYIWYSTSLEAGIDGYIEIRGENGQVTNCIIQVQSKATDRPFEGETESTFEYRCSEKDLNYWLAGNAPVILVRCRPRTNEAYWVSLKDYFRDLERRKSAKIIFNKTQNRFGINAKQDLQHLATQRDSGLYLGTHPKDEVIYSNLLELSPFPDRFFVAATEYRTRGEVFATLREFTKAVPGEWILGNKMLTSFHDLSTHPWTQICDRGTVEELDTLEWALSDDPVRRKQFVQLLNACLREKLYRKGVKFYRENQYYYFRSTLDLSEREYVYQSRENKTSRIVFKGYPSKQDQTQMAYYRHSAFQGRFVRYGDIWYLQITPTYHFTRDGERLSRYAPDLLSGIKRLETNQAVHGQVVMWAHLLTERNLFETESKFLQFASLLEFELNVGLDDEAWLKHEEVENYKTLQSPAVDDRQQSFIL